MTNLYPLKFKPIIKERIWGGTRLISHYNKKSLPGTKVGESWELSAIQSDKSVVSNGFLEGNTIEEIIEVYMGDLVGDSVYEKFGHEFPLLIKLIDAQDYLSIQVHPDDELARIRHNAHGKTEMWYVIESSPNAIIYSGFRKDTNKEEFTRLLKSGNLKEMLISDNPEPGDGFFIPAGRVHSMGGGLLVAEVQQTSDVTYRIFDWERMGPDGMPRELHADLAIDAIDFKGAQPGRIRRGKSNNAPVVLVESRYFNASIIEVNKKLERDYSLTDSFVILLCTAGSYKLSSDDFSDEVGKGETVLIPALIDSVSIEPDDSATILEVYLETNTDYE